MDPEIVRDLADEQCIIYVVTNAGRRGFFKESEKYSKVWFYNGECETAKPENFIKASEEEIKIFRKELFAHIEILNLELKRAKEIKNILSIK